MTGVIYEELDSVARITLNRPTRLNAINTVLAEELRRALERASASSATGAIILAAAGRAFCAGDDLAELAKGEIDAEGAERFVQDLQNATRLMMLGDKPVVCAAQGWIVGGGAAWLLNADFCLVAEDAVMFCPEARHGLFPTGGASLLLTERCGPVVANDVLWLGRRLNAQNLVELGVASSIAPAASLSDEALALARRLLELPPRPRLRLKQARIGDLLDRLERALAFEARCCLEAASDPSLGARIAASTRIWPGAAAGSCLGLPGPQGNIDTAGS